MATALLCRVLRRQPDAPAPSLAHEAPVAVRSVVLPVVAVGEESRRAWTTSVALVIALLAALSTLHPDWTTILTFVASDVLVTAVGTVRAIRRFRESLKEVEPLPWEAVEVAPRARPRRRRRPQSRWQRLRSLAVLAAFAAGNVIYFLQAERTWTERILAVLAGTLAAAMLVRPLVEEWLAARWEWRHRHARLFRVAELEHDWDAERQLYVATRPVPTA